MSESLSLVNIAFGIFYLMMSIVGGFWSHQNVNDRYREKPVSKLKTFICFAPPSVIFGTLAAQSFGIDPYWGILFGGIPFSISGKFEEFSRRQLRKGDGPTLEYFIKMAHGDGNEIKNRFSKKILTLVEQQQLSEPTVDILIQSYTETRAEFGLPPINIDEKDIPFI